MASSTKYDEALGFHYAIGHAGTSSDLADFRGSLTMANTFVSSAGTAAGSPADSKLFAATGAFSLEGIGFRYVAAVGGTSADVAYLHGSTTSHNTLYGNQTDASSRSDSHLISSVHSDEVVGFSKLYAYAGTAADVAHLYGANALQTPTDSYVSGINAGGHKYYVDAHDFNATFFNA